MQRQSAFDQGMIRVCLHCLTKIKQSMDIKNTSFHWNFDWQPLKIQNGLFHAYCINMYEKIHQNESATYK